jgi:hypothetical protein
MGGECDTPRVQAQLEQTILQFPTVTEAAIFINGKPLQDVLSLKGTDLQPAPTNPAPTQNMVKIFLIAVNDNGQSRPRRWGAATAPSRSRSRSRLLPAC